MIKVEIYAWKDKELHGFVSYGIMVNGVPLWHIPETAKAVHGRLISLDTVWKSLKKSLSL